MTSPFCIVNNLYPTMLVALPCLEPRLGQVGASGERAFFCGLVDGVGDTNNFFSTPFVVVADWFLLLYKHVSLEGSMSTDIHHLEYYKVNSCITLELADL